MNGRAPAILDHLTALSDATRSRILLLLDRHELTVSELCTIMQLPQSTASRHLKALADSGWIAARAEGTSHLYTMTRSSTRSTGSGSTVSCIEPSTGSECPGPSTRSGSRRAESRSEHVEGRDELDPAARRLWLLVREQVGPTPAAAQDLRRLQTALADRRTKSVEFFQSAAGQWDRLRDELFGDRVHLAALAALADADCVAGDLGCGTGQVSAALAPFVARVIGVDASAAMLQAAKRRLATFDNVELRRGEVEALPIDDERLGIAVLMLVLHHLPEPAKALADVRRVLKPGGRVVLGDMLPHDRESYRQQMGHVWLGFSEESVSRLLTDAGFTRVRIVALAADARVKGPGLFVATGEKSA